MDPEIGRTTDPVSVEDDLLDRPEAWEFFAAIRALAATRPGPGVGRSTRIEQDTIRFRQKPSLRMEPAELADAVQADGPNGLTIELTQTAFGPFGPQGALPQHVTEDAIEAGFLGNHDLPHFLDLFTHRMTALLYRAWETTQIAVSRDRGAADPYRVWINALFGQGTDGLSERDRLPDDVKRYLSGWLGNPRGSVAAIESVLSVVIGAPATVEEFIAEWLPIAEEDQARLGVAPARLGEDIVIGRRYYSLQSRIRIRTARLTAERFEELLPDGPRHGAVLDAMRNLVGLALGWELQLVLDRQEIPRLSLDGSRRLGWDTWAIEDARFDDAVDVLIEGTWRAPRKTYSPAED
ncbi:MAG: type VI secretion system baseplate subunit TssG [Pseudomonadota bacterium]